MKNVKEMLEKSRGPRPGRPLKADFTQQVMQTVAKLPEHRPWWARYLRLRSIGAMSKPILALLILAVVVATGGSVYAVVSNWPQPSAKLRKEMTLPSGDRIVTIDISNCASSEVQQSGDLKIDDKTTKYYEIRKDSELNNEQVVDMVQTICEETIAEHAVHTIITERYGDLSDGSPVIMSKSGVMVKAITETSITLGYDPAWFDNAELAIAGDDKYKVVASDDVTFTRFAPDLQVFDRAQAIAYSDLRVGDSLKVIYRDEHTLPSEADPGPLHWDNFSKIVIEAVVRTKPTSSPTQFYWLLSTDFVRVEPCEESPSGFCRAYDFIKDDFTTGLKLERQN